MAFLSTLDWPIRIVLGVVVAGALSAGVVLAVRTSGGDDAQVAGQLTGTPPTLALTATPGTPTLAPSDTPAPPTATQPAPTQPPPTEAPPTATPYPPLPPPPPKPENPTEVDSEMLAGGQWYRFYDCVDFYLPPGWTFRVNVGVQDPGGGIMTFVEAASNSSILFPYENLSQPERRVLEPAVGPALDQIAATFEVVC